MAAAAHQLESTALEMLLELQSRFGLWDGCGTPMAVLEELEMVLEAGHTYGKDDNGAATYTYTPPKPSILCGISPAIARGVEILAPHLPLGAASEPHGGAAGDFDRFGFLAGLLLLTPARERGIVAELMFMATDREGCGRVRRSEVLVFVEVTLNERLSKPHPPVFMCTGRNSIRLSTQPTSP